jgi:hypothetical protein
MQKMICRSCGWSTSTKADGTFVNHTVNGQRIRLGTRKDGRKCRMSGKQARAPR